MTNESFPASAALAAKAICNLIIGDIREAHVLVTGYTGSIAHSGRALYVAEALSSLGVRVTKAGDFNQPYSKSILNIDPGWDAPYLDQGHVNAYAQRHCSWGFYDKNTLMSHVMAWRQLIKKEPFDIVVGDFAIPAIIAAESLGIRTVTIQNALWTSAFRYRLMPPEDHVIQRTFAKLGLAAFTRKLSSRFGATNIIYAIYQRHWSRPYNSVRRSLGLKTRNTYYAHTEGQLAIIPDLPQIWGRYGESSSKKYIAVGPIIWEPKKSDQPGSSSIQAMIESGRPFIYATLGSSGTRETFDLLFEAFRQRHDGLALALTTGEQFTGWEGWNRKPANVFMDSYFPGRLALGAQGCVGAINHGGSGSAYQALLTPPAKPMIMIPTHAEQQWNAEILEGMGFGLVMKKNKLSPRCLNDAIDHVLTLRPTINPSAWV